MNTMHNPQALRAMFERINADCAKDDPDSVVPLTVDNIEYYAEQISNIFADDDPTWDACLEAARTMCVD